MPRILDHYSFLLESVMLKTLDNRMQVDNTYELKQWSTVAFTVLLCGGGVVRDNVSVTSCRL